MFEGSGAALATPEFDNVFHAAEDAHGHEAVEGVLEGDQAAIDERFVLGLAVAGGVHPGSDGAEERAHGAFGKADVLASNLDGVGAPAFGHGAASGGVGWTHGVDHEGDFVVVFVFERHGGGEEGSGDAHAEHAGHEAFAAFDGVKQAAVFVGHFG